jgi:Mlc titration factor MtfA (ptsG expression regulator)
MIAAWWRGWRDRRAASRRAIPDVLWNATVARHPFIARRSAEDLSRLRHLAMLFLDRKEFTGVNGFVVTDEIAVSIAAQACLPVLHLGLEGYGRFVGIVVHPHEVVARRERVDEAGVVHRYDELLSGEAMEGGPVMLAWSDAQGLANPAGEPAGSWAYNVVIHEFAHVLDMGDGRADGIPPLADRAARAAWSTVIDDEYARFCDRVDRDDDTLLDPYGAESVDEFFAVASEVFFVAPAGLLDEHPRLYELLAGYYRQDPARG